MHEYVDTIEIESERRNRLNQTIDELGVGEEFLRDEIAEIAMDDPQIYTALMMQYRNAGYTISCNHASWTSFTILIAERIFSCDWGIFASKKTFARKLRKFLGLSEESYANDPTGQKAEELQKFCSGELDAAQHKLRVLVKQDERKKKELFSALVEICTAKDTAKKIGVNVPGNDVLEEKLREAMRLTDDRMSTFQGKLVELESARKQIKALAKSACAQENARQVLARYDNLEHQMEDADIVSATLQAAYAEKRTCEEIVQLLDRMAQQTTSLESSTNSPEDQPLVSSIDVESNTMKPPIPQDSTLSTDSRRTKTLAVN